MPAERSPLWRQLPPVAEPTSAQLDEIRHAIDDGLRRRAARQRRRLRLIPGLLLGLGILWWFLAWRVTPVVPEPDRGGTDLANARGSGASRSAVTPQALQALVPEPPPAMQASAPAPTIAAIAPSHHRSSAAARSVPEARSDDPEAALLAGALKQLRREHNPLGALALLKTYQREFPAGVLRPEATLVEAESLVALGKHQEIVDLLNPEVVSELPRSTELSLLRAEALSRLDRCREAIPVFNALLSTTVEDEPALDSSLRERALFGRALCHARGGQVAAARRDLELEVAQFPDEAAKARQTLESLPTSP